MKRFTARILGLLAALVLIVFAVANATGDRGVRPDLAWRPHSGGQRPIVDRTYRHLSGADRLDGRLGQPALAPAAGQARAQLRRNLETRASLPGAFQPPSPRS